MKRVMLVIIGFICLALGIIGAFFPVMPTTPFVLLAAFCFLKSSPELYERVKTIPWLGDFIAQYMETDSMTTRARLEAIAILWIGLILSALLIRNNTMSVVFAVIGIAVTIHLWTIRRTPRKHTSDFTDEGATNTDGSLDIAGDCVVVAEAVGGDTETIHVVEERIDPGGMEILEEDLEVIESLMP